MDSQTGLVNDSPSKTQKYQTDEEQPAQVKFAMKEQRPSKHVSEHSIAQSLPDEEDGIPEVSLGVAIQQNNLNNIQN